MPTGKSNLPGDALTPSDFPEPDPFHRPATALEDVIATDLLSQRPKRRADYRAETEALGGLAQTMATSPEAIFQQLVDVALELCGAQSAGISLLEKTATPTVFRWHATAGIFAPLVGSTLPR